MEINEEARKLLENKVKRILNEIDIPESQKIEIRKELVSNYTDASIMNAQSRGVSNVEKQDVESAFESSESPDEIASMYMASYVNSLHKAGIISRTIAFAIDMILINIFAVTAALPFIILRFVLDPPTSEVRMIPAFLQFFYIFVIANMTIVFAYFVVSEGFFGYTPGKWLLGIKVLRADGKKASYPETMIRSIPKLFIVAIIADALLMLILYRKDRQRLFDRIAGTIVISRNKK
jgi:uncharacterized RDD family membrane protein YckC